MYNITNTEIILGPDGSNIPVKTKDLGDNSVKVEYSPQKTGCYFVCYFSGNSCFK